MLRQVTEFKSVSSNRTDFDIVMDDMPNYQPAQPPLNQQPPPTAPVAYTHNLSHGTNIQYPQFISSQQAVITNQVKRCIYNLNMCTLTNY